MNPSSPIFAKLMGDCGFDVSTATEGKVLYVSSWSGKRCECLGAGDRVMVSTNFTIPGHGTACELDSEDDLLGFVDAILSAKPDAHESERTERLAEVKVRTKQAKFRQGLFDLWGGKCALTGESFEPLLRASHAKPWAESNNEERMSPYNGLLLRADIDVLFDGGWITFADDGTVVLAKAVPLLSINIYGAISMALLPEHIRYFEWHRLNVFQG